MRKVVLFLVAMTCISVRAEPLKDFEAIVQRCKNAFDSRAATDVRNIPMVKVWVKRAFGPTKLAYDVSKTDSLVTPFTGHINITEIISSKRASDEASALALDVAYDSDPAQIFTRINYVYQNSKWIVSGGQSSMDGGQKSALDRDRMLEKVGTFQSCF